MNEHRFKVGDKYSYNGYSEFGTYEVTKVCKSRAKPGTIFIHIKTLSGNIVASPFMIGSPFDINSNSMK
jgi:hypothetical protein